LVQIGKAQDNRIGIYGGLSYSQITGESLAFSNESRPGISLGVNFDMLYDEQFSFLVGANYSEMGNVDIIELTDTNGNRTGKTSPIRFHYDYIGFPLKIGWRFGEKVEFLGRIGLTPSILIGANILTYDLDVDGNKKGDDYLKFSIQDQITLLDLVASAEAEINYLKMKDFNLFNRVMFRHGLNRLQRQASSSQTSLRHFGWSFDFGVKYSLP